MTTTKTLILSLGLLLMGTTTGFTQDTIPSPRGEEQPPQLMVQQWVQPNAEGDLIGQILTGDETPVGTCRVALVGADGVVARFTSDDGGKVVLTDVAPGVYAMALRGENLVAAYALQVVSPDLENVDRDATFGISAARVDSAKFYGQVVRLIPAQGADAYPYNAEEAQAVMRALKQPGLARVEQADGGLQGCLYAPGEQNGGLVAAPDTHVFILRDGLEIDRQMTDAQGCYEVPDLAPGRYALIAVGPTGVAVTSFNLVASSATAQQDQASPFRLASAVQPPGTDSVPRLDLQISPPQGTMLGFGDLGPGEDGLGPPPFPLPPGGLAPPPGFGGGLGGGAGGGVGGGGGGLGGAGSLIGLAGLAGLAGLSGDDDGFDVPTPASPAVAAP